MMRKTSTLDRRGLRERVRKQKQQQKALQIGMIAAGVLLVLSSAYLLLADDKMPQAKSSYRPEDVVHDTPLFAIHEMDGPQLDAIPFLPEDGPQPVIAVSESFHDIGLIGPQDVVTYDFAIFNQGEAPLTISRAYTTCGCTTAEFTATVIPPGMVSVMTLTLDAGYHDIAGQTVRRGVLIENNDPDRPQMEIWVQAAVGRQ